MNPSMVGLGVAELESRLQRDRLEKIETRLGRIEQKLDRLLAALAEEQDQSVDHILGQPTPAERDPLEPL